MNKKEKKTDLIKGFTTFKMVIPENVESKIRHLCNAVHDVEWSGILYYRKDGNFENGDLVITCVDILVMDIGSSAYTEFSESADIITFRADKDLIDNNIYEGLIHSHNNMSTFFSSTDLATLLEEGERCNHFVSLIVNNAGSYTAAITRKINTVSEIETHVKSINTSSYNSFNNTEITIEENRVSESDKNDTVEKTYVEWFSLDIEKAEVMETFTEIDERLDEIRRNKKGRIRNDAPVFSSYSTPYSYGSYGGYKASSEKVSDTYSDEVKDFAVQMLTGSILINRKSFNVNDWVNKMDSVYERRFGSLDASKHANEDSNTIEGNNKVLDSWIESFTELLVTLNRISFMDSCGKALMKYMASLPYSYVKQKMINELYYYVPDTTDDIFYNRSY